MILIAFVQYREHWQSGPENVERGKQWLAQIYQRDLSGIFKHFEGHKDFGEPRPPPSTSQTN